MNQDEQHLRLLSIFHYVLGGMAAVFSLFPIIYLILGLALLFAPEAFETEGQPPPVFVAWFFIVLAVVFIVMGGTLAGFVIATGCCLAKKKRYLFCLVMAGIECIFMPIGTVLGVFTIIVLMRDSVKGAFSANKTVEVT